METVLLDTLENFSCSDYKEFCWYLANYTNCNLPDNPNNRYELLVFLKPRFSTDEICKYFKKALKEASFNNAWHILAEKIIQLHHKDKSISLTHSVNNLQISDTSDLKIIQDELNILKDRIVKLENKVFTEIK